MPVDQDLTIQDILAGQFIGTALAVAIYAVDIAEFIRYCSAYPNEPLLTWGLVVPVFVLVGIQTGTIFSWTYYQMVSRYAQLSVLFEVDWQLKVQAVFSATVMFATQTFYAQRLWTLRRKPVGLLVIYAVLLPLGWGLGLTGTISATETPHIKSVLNVDYAAIDRWETKWRGCRIAQFVVNIITDLTICGGMLFTLLRAKSDIGNSAMDTLVLKLIRLVFDTMLLPTIIVIGTVVMYLVYGNANGNQRIFAYPQSGVHLFSLLHTLLARQKLREIMESLHNPSVSINLTMPDGESSNIKDKSAVSPITLKGFRQTGSVDGEGDAPVWSRTFGWRNESPVAKNTWQTGILENGYRDLDRTRVTHPEPMGDSRYETEATHEHRRPLSRFGKFETDASSDGHDGLSPHVISYELEKLRLRSPPAVHRP